MKLANAECLRLEDLSNYLERRLSAAVQLRVEAHFDQCSACAARIAEMRRFETAAELQPESVTLEFISETLASPPVRWTVRLPEPAARKSKWWEPWFPLGSMRRRSSHASK